MEELENRMVIDSQWELLEKEREEGNEEYEL